MKICGIMESTGYPTLNKKKYSEEEKRSGCAGLIGASASFRRFDCETRIYIFVSPPQPSSNISALIQPSAPRINSNASANLITSAAGRFCSRRTKRHGRFALSQNHDFEMVIARTYLPAKMAIRLIRANDGKRDSGNREGLGAQDERGRGGSRGRMWRTEGRVRQLSRCR
jgi:hypothetical protein